MQRPQHNCIHISSSYLVLFVGHLLHRAAHRWARLRYRRNSRDRGCMWLGAVIGGCLPTAIVTAGTDPMHAGRHKGGPCVRRPVARTKRSWRPPGPLHRPLSCGRCGSCGSCGWTSAQQACMNEPHEHLVLVPGEDPPATLCTRMHSMHAWNPNVDTIKARMCTVATLTAVAQTR